MRCVWESDMFFDRWKARVFAAAILIAGFFAAVAKIKDKGRKEERARDDLEDAQFEVETLKRNVEAVKTRDAVAADIDTLPADSATARLRNEWSRDQPDADDRR